MIKAAAHIMLTRLNRKRGDGSDLIREETGGKLCSAHNSSGDPALSANGSSISCTSMGRGVNAVQSRFTACPIQRGLVLSGQSNHGTSLSADSSAGGVPESYRRVWERVSGSMCGKAKIFKTNIGSEWWRAHAYGETR